MLNELIGKKIEFSISDPFELGGETASGLVEAVEEANGGSILIKMNKPLFHENVSYEYFVASPRYKNGNMGLLLKNETVDCGLTNTTPERARSASPCDVSWWRGGLGMIGGVKLSA